MTAVIGTALFVLLTALIMGHDVVYPLLHPSGFIRTGSPFFAFEVYLVLIGRAPAGAAGETPAGQPAKTPGVTER